MIIENPEFKEEITHLDIGDYTDSYVVLPKDLPGKHGAAILMLTNLKYFLEMYTLDDRECFLGPYEILAELEERVHNGIATGEIGTNYMIDFKRASENSGVVTFDFSHFEVNTETEPDENYRSLYIYFEYSGSAV